MDTQQKFWPPTYQLRRSPKARRVSLRVSDEKGLELVLPQKAHSLDIDDVLEAHRPWIIRQLARRDERLARRDALHAASPLTPPAGFWLHGGELRVDLDIGAAKRGSTGGAAMQELLAASPASGTVIWPMPAGADAAIMRRVMSCIKAYANIYLSVRVRELAREHSLSFSQITLGSQKSRWGSYSMQGVIRLNRKLIFLPPALCGHVVLHELCHSVHHNHSSGFWELMRSLDPATDKKNNELQNAGIWIPAWFS